jgi:hypothetical protein
VSALRMAISTGCLITVCSACLVTRSARELTDDDLAAIVVGAEQEAVDSLRQQ